jgi:hypothetical protein
MPADDWSIARGFSRCYALGWSPLPLVPETKRPPFKSWPARCIVPLTDEELQRLYRPGHELGVCCGYGGLVVADVDAGGDKARALLQELLGPPLAVVLGRQPGARFKAIYRGPWAQPPPELQRAALDYAEAGQELARAEYSKRRWESLGLNPRAIKHLPAAVQAKADAENRRDEAKVVFGKLLDAFIAANRLIRSVDLSNSEVTIQILSFKKVAVLPPSRHPQSPTGFYRWEGAAP